MVSLVVAQQSCAANSNFQRCRLTMHVKQILSAALDRWLRQLSEEEPWSPLHMNPQLMTVWHRVGVDEHVWCRSDQYLLRRVQAEAGGSTSDDHNRAVHFMVDCGRLGSSRIVE